MINRTAPASRPSGANDGTQSWQSLLFCHWQVPLHAIRSCVPSELQINTFEGNAYVGLVPFRMCDVRSRWLPRRISFNFLETNVRTYVVHRGRPGVYFFSLDANSRLAVMAARTGWSLPYIYARMQASSERDVLSYASRRGRRGPGLRVSFRIDRELGPSAVGTLEHFLLERYLLFVEHRKQIHVGQVHHTPYHAFTASIEDLQDQLIPAAGLPALSRPPDFSHYCGGVEVEVFGIKPVGDSASG